MYFSEKYYYVFVFIVILMAYFINGVRRDNIFNKKLYDCMLEEEEEYFEVRYSKGLYLFYLILSIPLSLLAVSTLLWTDTLFFVGIGGITGGFLLNFIYKSMVLIIYDHGNVSLYIGGRKKISGHIDEVDKEYTFSSVYGGGKSFYTSCIGFNEKDKIFFVPENMNNGHKLVSVMKRRNLYQAKRNS